jgi:hypothetical protein
MIDKKKDQRGQNKRRYSFNETYFSKLNEEKAYWLGVMYADGNVSSNKRNTTGRIIFSSVDKDWVEKFSKCINYTGPVREEIHKKFKRSIWKITLDSRRMFEDLVNLGCIPRKSLVIKFPSIEEDLLSHFVRGYFDGDGSVTVCQNLKSSRWKILKASISSGSESFIAELIQKIPSKNKNYYKGKRIFEIKLSLNDSINLYHFMYKKSTIRLDRKYVKFKDYISDYQTKRCSTTIIDLPKGKKE